MMLTNEERSRWLLEKCCVCGKTPPTNLITEISTGGSTAICKSCVKEMGRTAAIRECAALARQRADELQRNDGHRAAGEVIELRGIARDMEELLEAAHRAARPTGEGGDTNDENRPPREG